MAPPPRPPIICYDLQTNTNTRHALCARHHAPAVGGTRRTKVTVIHRDQNELNKSKALPCWRHVASPNRDQTRENSENFNLTNRRPAKSHQRNQSTSNQSLVFLRNASNDLVDPKPFRFGTRPFQGGQSSKTPCNSNNVRHAYGQKLKDEIEEKRHQQELKNKKIAVQAQIEEIYTQLESFKRLHENLLKSFGMGHNTAKYVQKLDDECAKLRQNLDSVAETRSRELGRRAQQMKRYHQQLQQEDRKAEEKRLRDMSRLTHCKHTFSSTLNNSLSSNSLTPNTVTNTTSSSPTTISLSSCSSSMSTDERIPSVHFVEPSPPPNRAPKLQTRPRTSNLLPSPTLSQNRRRDVTFSDRLSHSPKEKFSFFKYDPQKQEETIEVSDEAFFEKVEDKTMIEVIELVKGLKTVLKDLDNEVQ